METKVWEAIEGLLTNPLIAKEIVLGAIKEHSKVDYGQEEAKLKGKLNQLQGQLRSLAERLSEIPAEVDASPIYEQMKKIGVSKQGIEEKLLTVKKQNQDFEIPAELSSYVEFLKLVKEKSLLALSPELKQKILSKLVEKVRAVTLSLNSPTKCFPR